MCGCLMTSLILLLKEKIYRQMKSQGKMWVASCQLGLEEGAHKVAPRKQDYPGDVIYHAVFMEDDFLGIADQPPKLKSTHVKYSWEIQMRAPGRSPGASLRVWIIAVQHMSQSLDNCSSAHHLPWNGAGRDEGTCLPPVRAGQRPCSGGCRGSLHIADCTETSSCRGGRREVCEAQRCPLQHQTSSECDSLFFITP